MTKNQATKQSIWTKGYTCAFLANLMLCFSQSVANTLISTYAAFLGAGAVLVGTISGLYFGVAFAARPISGPVITLCNKKTLMMGTYVAGIITNVVYALAGSVPLFIVARVLHGLQFAFVGSLSLTIASDSVPREKLGSGIGVFGIGSALAMSVGPGLGIIIRDWSAARWDVAAGYTAVFLTAAFFMMLALVPTILMPRPKSQIDRAALGAWYHNIVAKETLLPSLLLCLVSLASILYNTYMVPYAEASGISSIALFFTVYAIVLLAARPGFGKLSDHVGPEKVLIPSLLVFLSSFVVVGLGKTLPMMLVGAVLAALGFGALSPTIQTLCIRTVEPARRGVASNTQYFGMDLGYFVGPLFGSMIYERISYSAMFLICGALPLVLALLLFLLTWGKLKRRLY